MPVSARRLTIDTHPMMQARNRTPHVSLTLTTWPFLSSLAVLILNDGWFKHAWPGVVTGKLSDVAGISLVTLLLIAAAPTRARIVMATLAAVFTWWKSPLAQPAIDAVNLHLPLSIGRVVDYTDLFALLVMPCCLPIARDPARFAIPGPRLRRLLTPPLAIATMFAVCATSAVPLQREYRFTQRDPAALLNHTVVAAAIAEAARKLDLECIECGQTSVTAAYRNDDLYFAYSFPAANTVAIAVTAYPGGFFLPNHDEAVKNADRLRGELQKRMANVYGNLEFDDRVGQLR